MKIKLVSDCHLEISSLEIKNDQNYDVLVLAGDMVSAQELHDYPIGHIVEKTNYRSVNAFRYREFLTQVSNEFPKVIIVAGNHEFYGGKFYQGIDQLYEEYSNYPNISFLEKDYVIVDGIAFVGATLWTDCNKLDPVTMYMVGKSMNDYYRIKNDQSGYRKVNTDDTIKRHRETLKYFDTIVKSLTADQDIKQIVMVTHHTPSFLSVAPQYKQDIYLNGAYHSDLSSFILDNPKITTWFHGHTHDDMDYYIGTTRIMCNPRGYISQSYIEQTGWNPNIIIEI
jgi:predicted MPP superfamily phosphohydrolase